MDDSQLQATGTDDILIVDDDLSSLELLSELLGREGYRVRPVNSPLMAIDSALAQPPSLVLLDIQMPGMDGFEVCARLKEDERTRGVPVIFLSAMNSTQDKARAFQTGGLDYIPKPYDEAEVLARVRTHINLRSMQLTMEQQVRERTARIIESEERFRGTFEQAAVGIAHVSMGGRFLRINRKFCDIVGYTQDDMRDLTFHDITHPDDLEADLEQAQKLISGAIPSYSMDKRYVRGDGTTVWVNLTVSLVFNRLGEARYFVSVVKDITDRKQAEKDLLKSERNLLDAQSIARTGSWEWDARGNKTTLSEELYRIFGIEIGAPFTYEGLIQSIHPEDRQHYDKDSHTWQTTREIDYNEYRIVRPDGSIRHVVAFERFDYDEVGKVIRRYGTVQDVTERKNSEREVSNLRDELFLATRRMAMGELTTAIAHELNQPLAAILTNAYAAKRFMKRDTPLLEEVEEILDDIISDGRRAADIINKLRGMLKKERHDYEDISLNEVIREVLSLTRNHMLITTIELETDFAEDLPTVYGDRIQLQQVFLNIVLNAAEALRDADSIEKKISIETVGLGDGKARISISDTGPGLGETERDILFNPLFTTKKEGMGVGLAISKTIVELHGGRIEVEDRPEGGAAFYVDLPCAGEG